MNMEKTIVYVDPRARLVFASQYIFGLYQVFGKKNVKFRLKPFKDLDHKADKEAFDHYLAMVIKNGSSEKRAVVDYRDKSTINDNAYEWCDIYGKINLNSGSTDKKYLGKIVSIGPMVAPRIWGFPCTAWLFITNYLRVWRHISVSPRYFLNGYRWQLSRPTLEDYSHVESDKDYIFFDSSLWARNRTAEATNEWRADFIRSCKTLDLQFQGGLIVYKEHPEMEKYRDVIVSEAVSQEEYIKRVKKSAVAFNTPSCHMGHGWKLGEFLAMGKAMVSTPVLNDMPVKLTHGENIHVIEKPEELKDAIERIRNDDAYRIKLEQGALDYYNQYLAPSSVINRLLAHLNGL